MGMQVNGHDEWIALTARWVNCGEAGCEIPQNRVVGFAGFGSNGSVKPGNIDVSPRVSIESDRINLYYDEFCLP